MKSSLPHGWHYEPPQPQACPCCGGSGKTKGSPHMVAPSGRRISAIGFNAKAAAVYAELWAPEKCSPERREELYGKTE